MPDAVLVRALPGLVIAAAIALAAHRAHLLSGGGAAAASLVGTACAVGGVAWIVTLLAFFVTSSGLTRWRAARKAAAVKGLVAKGGARDAVQVAANGGVFAAAALLSAFTGAAVWQAAGAGALAAATADTWSTEIGMAVGGTPRHLLRGHPLPRGASGGVTTPGSLAAVAGALFLALVVRALGWHIPLAAVVLGGAAGAFVDSLLGATLQERRWCPACAQHTERRVHPCGTVTSAAGGMPGFGNDGVNVASVVAGALVTTLLR